ncbi:MAG: iron-sulfur cluster assembly scaffold protein [Patescibacteria group bacterium]|nr:iron-sulfur cluster assembly scaffold protein [Patescibacteria group bacterium]
MYSKKVLNHFAKPRNLGEIKNPDGVGEAINPVCGDSTKISIKVKKIDGKAVVDDIKFRTLGCVAAVATSSLTTELAKGKSLAEIKKFTRDQVVWKLHGLPIKKVHCSNLALDALKKAIQDYQSKQRSKQKPKSIKKIRNKSK